MTDTKTETLPETTKGTTKPRHLVELTKDGRATDKALCGYLWDRLNVQHNRSICQECLDELRRRGQG